MKMLRRWTGVLAVAIAAAPAAASAQLFQVHLTGPAESPPNVSPGLGDFRVGFLGSTMFIHGSFAGLLGTTLASHIHCCTALPLAGTAGVATQVPTFSGFPLGVTAGSYSHVFNMLLPSSYNPAFLNNATNLGNTATALNTLRNGVASGHAYLNIHSTVFPTGEIRGFFTVAAVPEPSTYALMASGLLVLGGAAWRRRRA